VRRGRKTGDLHCKARSTLCRFSSYGADVCSRDAPADVKAQAHARRCSASPGRPACARQWIKERRQDSSRYRVAFVRHDERQLLTVTASTHAYPDEWDCRRLRRVLPERRRPMPCCICSGSLSTSAETAGLLRARAGKRVIRLASPGVSRACDLRFERASSPCALYRRRTASAYDFAASFSCRAAVCTLIGSSFSVNVGRNFPRSVEVKFPTLCVCGDQPLT